MGQMVAEYFAECVRFRSQVSFPLEILDPKAQVTLRKQLDASIVENNLVNF